MNDMSPNKAEREAKLEGMGCKRKRVEDALPLSEYTRSLSVLHTDVSTTNAHRGCTCGIVVCSVGHECFVNHGVCCSGGHYRMPWKSRGWSPSL